jgi:dihydrofolate reductase
MSWLGEYLATPNPVAEKLVSDIRLPPGRGQYQSARRTRTAELTRKGLQRHLVRPVYVVTHHPPESDPTGDVTYLNDLDAAIAQARTTAGDRHVNVLGADLARQCLERGEVEGDLGLHRAGPPR